MTDEELLKLAENLEDIAKSCDTVTTGNIAHRLVKLKAAILNSAEFIKLKLEKQ